MSSFLSRVGALALVAGTGCASVTYTPEQAPEMAIVRDYAPFYRLGPMQSRGPDATLRAGERVKLTRREPGYSLVLLEDGRTGYVPNEDMAPAPPRPKPTPEPSASAGSSNRRSGERYRGAPVNDSPLPEEPPPSLDLDIGPEDVVAPPPPPPPLDPAEEKPKFRY